MADETRLKEIFEGIECDAEEAVAMRLRLASTLTTGYQRDTPGSALLRWSPLAAMVVVALFLVLQNQPKVELLGQDPEVLLSMAEAKQSLLVEAAMSMRESTNPAERDAARIILCKQLPPQEGLKLALEGAKESIHPAYRSFYLEYLVDHGEEFRPEEVMVEYLLDVESDETCVYLLRELLKFT